MKCPDQISDGTQQPGFEQKVTASASSHLREEWSIDIFEILYNNTGSGIIKVSCKTNLVID